MGEVIHPLELRAALVQQRDHPPTRAASWFFVDRELGQQTDSPSDGPVVFPSNPLISRFTNVDPRATRLLPGRDPLHGGTPSRSSTSTGPLPLFPRSRPS